jgi:hypothetical protein
MNDIFKNGGVPVKIQYGFQYDPDGNPIDETYTYTIYRKGKGNK